ncbi:Acyl-CoA dehydrogenase OS=Streptomyces microflavus OX=1919 GN=Smic_29640 PE=3 SV=1 [Streptomyces microflavus]
MLRETIRALAETKIAPFAAAVDEESRFPQEALDALVASDLHAIHVPEEYGGAGADALATVIVIEEVARACASSSHIPAVNKLGSLPVILSGSEELKRKYLGPLAKGDAMFSYALSEPGRRLRRGGHEDQSRARRRLLGPQRCEALDHQRGRLRVLHGHGGHRPHQALQGHLRVRRREVRRGHVLGAPEKKLGIKGSPTREVYLDNVRIPADRMIGEEGTGCATAMKTLDHTRITIAAQALGIAQGALDYAKGYVQERKQFGKPIADFQGIQFMLADMAMKLEAARQLTYSAAAKSQRVDGDLPFFGAAAECFASDVAMEVTTDAVQLLGGYGYTRDYPVEHMMRDAEITQIYEGTNQVQRIVMAHNLP